LTPEPKPDEQPAEQHPVVKKGRDVMRALKRAERADRHAARSMGEWLEMCAKYGVPVKFLPHEEEAQPNDGRADTTQAEDAARNAS
jgi:hypothetical protein